MDPASLACPRCHTPLVQTAGGLVCPACALEHALVVDDKPEPPADGEAFPRPFGGYVLLGEVGRGGMGLVFKAHQLSLDRIVALKVLLYGSFSDTASRRRFRAEAESAARLQHPNIVAIHEIGEQDGVPYLTMDLVDGPDLSRHCAGRPLAAGTAAQLLREMARAVQAAHAAGVLHRDLKPSNIIIGSDGRPRITDFGLAKREDAGASSGLTAIGQVLGSPSYVSPEQAAGRTQEIGAPSDVYGLGTVLYHLITGRAPFVAASATQTLRLVLETEPVAPHVLNPDLPRDLETICLKCLQKEPARRYATAALLADDLERFLENRPIRARPMSPVGRTWRWCRRHPAVAILTAALMFVLGTAAVIATLQARRTEQARMLAEQARNSALVSRGEAEKLTIWLLDDLCNDIEATGRRDQVAKLAQQAVAYYENLPLESRSPDTERRHASALGHLTNALAAESRFGEAAESTQKAVAILERLYRQGDRSEATLVALVGAKNQAIVDEIRKDNAQAALQAAARNVGLIEARANQPGASFAIRRYYALSLRIFGLCWARAGNNLVALTYFERALAIQRELSKKPEADAVLVNETASTLLNLTGALGMLTDHRFEIRALLEESAEAVERVLKEQPADIRLREMLGRLQDTLGSFFVGELNAREALHWRQRAISTWEHCGMLDPFRPEFQFNLYVSRISARYVQAAQGQVTTALAGWRADLDACTRQQGPVGSLSKTNLQWRYLAMWLAKNSDSNGAWDALAQQRKVLTRTVDNAAAESELARRAQAQVLTAAAEVALLLGDLSTARAQAQAVLTLNEQCPKVSRPMLRVNERTARSVLSWVSLHVGDNAAAAAIADTEDPPPTHKYALRAEYVELKTPRALALARLGRDEEARALIEPAVAFLRGALADQPGHCASLEELAWAIYVEAAAQPAGANERRQALLAEAAALVAAMTDDYRALRPVQELRSWITAAQGTAGRA